MPTPLTITTGRRPDDTAVLKAVGEIDMTNADTLASHLGKTSGRLVVDLTDVEYLDSAGLSVLFAHADRIELIAGPLLLPVLTVSGLADLMTIHSADTDH
ncbi:STAS domain-containing protein [Streptomyces sp. NPDC052687]|uniref:STAS domain-containing protein n=1 Tax=Streptomyces sp. NPDC052687 TaxID=3154759 RepID=UPI00342A8CFF